MYVYMQVCVCVCFCVSDTRDGLDTDPFWHILFCCRESKLKRKKIHSAQLQILRQEVYCEREMAGEKVQEREGEDKGKERVWHWGKKYITFLTSKESNIANGLDWMRQTHPNISNKGRKQKMSEWLTGSVNNIMAFQIASGLKILFQVLFTIASTYCIFVHMRRNHNRSKVATLKESFRWLLQFPSC